MYKIKKLILYILTLVFLILSGIELFKYFYVDTTLYGVIYLLVNLIILFFLIPVTYNYKRNFSNARISKLIIILIIGIFNSYILDKIVISNMSYVDSSTIYLNSIFVCKNILKGIVYGSLMVFTFFEAKLNKRISKLIKNIKKVDFSK